MHFFSFENLPKWTRIAFCPVSRENVDGLGSVASPVRMGFQDLKQTILYLMFIPFIRI